MVCVGKVLSLSCAVHCPALHVTMHERGEVILANSAFMHGTLPVFLQSDIRGSSGNNHPTGCRIFKGLIIDSGANKSSIVCLNQYNAYCKEFGMVSNIDKSVVKQVRGIGGQTQSIGSARYEYLSISLVLLSILFFIS